MSAEHQAELKGAAGEIPLKRLVVPGRKVRIFFNKGNVNNRTAHIRAIVDEDQVIYRYWEKGTQRWVYMIESFYYFKLLFQGGNLLESTGKQIRKGDNND